MDTIDEMSQRGESSSNTQITDLPSCLVRDILSRLTTKTLLNCRYVCKDWFNICSDSLLIVTQLARFHTCFLQKRITVTGKLRFGWVVEEVTNDIGDGNFHIQTTDFHSELEFPNSGFYCVNSCNGLLCLSDGGKSGVVYVCNPLLGELITIPLPNRPDTTAGDLAFGFSPMSNQYKLLRAFYLPEKQAEVYTLGTGQWKSIGNNPLRHTKVWLNTNTFLNGSLHWAHKRNDYICSFNFDNELFSTLPLPPRIGTDVVVCLGVSNGCLWVSLLHNQFGYLALEVWVMKEYGVEESWTLMVVITDGIGDSGISPWNVNKILRCEGRLHLPSIEPLFSLNEEDEVLAYEWGDGCFSSYNLKRRRCRHPQTIGPPLDKYARVMAYNPSLVSLQDVAKGEQLTVSREKAIGKQKEAMELR